MQKGHLFRVLDWKGKFYAAACDINEAAMKGLINRQVQEMQYGSNYTYTTLEGVLICKFYKDSCFGFSSQAYGVEVPAPYLMFPEVKAELDARAAKLGLL